MKSKLATWLWTQGVVVTLGITSCGSQAGEHRPASATTRTATTALNFPSQEPSATTASAVRISGEVRDGRPLALQPNLVIPYDLPVVAGATIRLVTFGLEARSDHAGRFQFPPITVAPPCMKVDVEASAPGFGTWRLVGIPVYPGASGVGLDIQLDGSPHAEVDQAGGAAAQGLRFCH